MNLRLAAAAAILAAWVSPALAAGIGVFDMTKVTSDYELYKTYDQQLQRFYSELQAEMAEFMSTCLLSSEELGELSALKAKPSPSDAEKARILELKGLTEKRDARRRELEQKMNPSEAEAAELRDLESKNQAAQAQLKAKNEELTGKFDQRSGQYQAEVDANVRAMIATVAKEKGLDAVVSKDMRLPDKNASMMFSVVLYGGTDITDEVLSRLNKKPGS